MATPANPTQTEAPDAAEPDLPPIRELTLEETRAHFDAQVRKLLGISGQEFLRRKHSGELHAEYDGDPYDPPTIGYLMQLSDVVDE